MSDPDRHIVTVPHDDPRAPYVAHDDVQHWPRFTGPLDELPRDRNDILRTFGDPRLRGADGVPVGQPDPAWERRNIVELHGSDRLPGVPERLYFHCHRLAEPYIREALRRATVICPDYALYQAASYVYRHMRHDPKRALSLHSWGIAVDVNSRDNRGIEYKRGEKVPKYFSDDWKRTWPRGVPRTFVDAFLSVGFTWGGDWDGDGRSDDHTFLDPMHFELTDPTR